MPSLVRRRASLRILVLLLAGISWQTCHADEVQTSKLSDGVYTLQLASTNCFLSYQNRTCARNEPVVRPQTLWNKWAVRVVDEEQGIVTLKTSVDDGKCPDGTLRRSAEDWCRVPPYATEVGIMEQSLVPPQQHELFQLVPVDGAAGRDGLFHVLAVGKPSTCARYLGATGCGSGSVQTKLGVEGEEDLLTTWRLSMVKGSTPAPSALLPPAVTSPTQAPAAAPTPVPTPTVSRPPPQPIPGPVIEPSIYGQSIVSYGFIDVSVRRLGGNSACSVSSITFMTLNTVTQLTTSTAAYSATNVKKLPVAIPLIAGYKHEVSAVGMCTDGRITERSNVLSIESVSPRVSGWVLGAPGQSCDQACAAVRKSCNAAPLQTVKTQAQVLFVAKEVGATLDPNLLWLDCGVGSGCGPSSGFVPGYTPTILVYNGNVGDCPSFGPLFVRFCCCGSYCPVA